MSSQEPLADDAEQSRRAENDSLDSNTAPTKNGYDHTTVDVPLDVTIKFSKSDLKLKGSKAALIAGSNFFREHFEDVRSPHLRTAIEKWPTNRPHSTHPNEHSPRQKPSSPA
jgi:hypothetical protein